MYSHKGQLIHSGTFLDENKLKNEIIKITKSIRVDLNLWKEGEYLYLTIDLVEPKIISEIVINQIESNIISTLENKYNLHKITIKKITNKETLNLIEIDLISRSFSK